jgi:hypothetical protein
MTAKYNFLALHRQTGRDGVNGSNWWDIALQTKIGTYVCIGNGNTDGILRTVGISLFTCRKGIFSILYACDGVIPFESVVAIASPTSV